MKRRYQLDFFRGIFLIIITIDHFLSDNNIIKRFTYESVGWVTAAEGFVFLSGLTADLVYTHKYNNNSQKSLMMTATKRAWKIYQNHMVIFLLVILLLMSSEFMRESWAGKFDLLYEQPLLALFLGATLLYQPDYLDILPMYAIFILIVPSVINLFRKGYIWQVLIVSALIYCVGIAIGVNNLADKFAWYISIDMGEFNLLCWQFLFILGLVSGFLFYNGKTDRIIYNKKVIFISLLVAGGLLLAKTIHLDDYRIVGMLIGRSYLGPLRLLNFWALFIAVVFVSTKYADKFNNKLVCYLGQYSLEVFSLHVFLIVLFKPLQNYLNTFFFIKLTEHYVIYPLGTLILLFLIIPSLYLAPKLLSQKARLAKQNW